METNLLLSDLINFSGVNATIVSPAGYDRYDPDLEIIGITSNSNEVKAGFLFAALHGSNFNGAEFVPEAVARGAVAILIDGTSEVLLKPITVHAISTDSPRRLFALMSAKFYRNQPDFIAAVTGTNGKTSVVEFSRQLWAMNGVRSASLGTLGVVADNLKLRSELTSPDPVSLHANLNVLSQNGVTNLAIEASSHGLDQNRLDGVSIQSAAFTNLSQDHLDYHEDQASYFLCKSRLFSELLAETGIAVLNADSSYFNELRQICQDRKISILSYGYSAQATMRVLRVRPYLSGQQVKLKVNDVAFEIYLSLIGEFQLFNALAALGLVSAEEGSEIENYLKGLDKLKGVPGRLEHIGTHPTGAPIVIDYAHTPDALKNILISLRPHVKGKLVCVFGAGGDRDKEKRPFMGKIASGLADLTIVTDDNPRSESPSAIREEIMKGCPSAQNVGGRSEAIRLGLSKLSDGDLLVIAGKGHETGQEIGGATIPFNDAAFVSTQLNDVVGGAS